MRKLKRPARINLEASVAAAGKTTAEGLQQEIADILFSVSSAFHSQNFYATASNGTVAAHSSVAMDREGRYPVADLSYLPRGTNITYMTLEPTGLPILDQKRLSSMLVRVRAKTSGPIDNIKNDIKTADQTIEQKAANELLLTIGARRSSLEKSIELPVACNVDLDREYSEGYYQRACVQARLGKIKEAMASLEKAVELDSDQLDYMVEEEDLKPLASLPAFKRLLAGLEPVKQ